MERQDGAERDDGITLRRAEQMRGGRVRWRQGRIDRKAAAEVGIGH